MLGPDGNYVTTAVHTSLLNAIGSQTSHAITMRSNRTDPPLGRRMGTETSNVSHPPHGLQASSLDAVGTAG